MFHTLTSVPLSDAVASRLPSRDSAMQQSALLWALMNLVCRRSYSSIRACGTGELRGGSGEGAKPKCCSSSAAYNNSAHIIILQPCPNHDIQTPP